MLPFLDLCVIMSYMTKEQYRYWLKGYLSDKLSKTQIETVISTFDLMGVNSQFNSLGSGSVTVPYLGGLQGVPTPGTWSGQVMCGSSSSGTQTTNSSGLNSIAALTEALASL